MFSLEEKPAREILMSLHGIAYIFALLALASGIAWVYYVAKAVESDAIGGKHGRGSNEVNGAPGETRQVDTNEVMFQGTVVAILLYGVFRHHFNIHY
jgi:hypothetical protein